MTALLRVPNQYPVAIPHGCVVLDPAIREALIKPSFDHVEALKTPPAADVVEEVGRE